MLNAVGGLRQPTIQETPEEVSAPWYPLYLVLVAVVAELGGWSLPVVKLRRRCQLEAVVAVPAGGRSGGASWRPWRWCQLEAAAVAVNC